MNDGTEVPSMLATGLTTLLNLCLRAELSRADSREQADVGCRFLTVSCVRSKHIKRDKNYSSTSVCEYFKTFEQKGADSIMTQGNYTLDDLMTFGRTRK